MWKGEAPLCHAHRLAQTVDLLDEQAAASVE
jgi:hypothetical protein